MYSSRFFKKRSVCIIPITNEIEWIKTKWVEMWISEFVRMSEFWWVRNPIYWSYPHTSCLPLRMCMNFISVDWVIWRSICFTLFSPNVCEFFFVRKWFGSSCIYLRWHQSVEQIMLLKRKYFWIGHKRDIIQRQQKLTARLHKNGDVTKRLVGRCHLQDDAPIIMTVMKGELSRLMLRAHCVSVLRLCVESGW